MPAVVDHIFICTEAGAPVAARLVDLGLTEGAPNRHPGQGTACRRFFFHNAYLELIWIEDAAEARTAEPRLGLWNRFSEIGSGASPFGILLRPAPGSPAGCPFAAWDYRPASMPDLKIQVADGTAVDEPLWCYLPEGRAPADYPPARRQPLDHAAGMREIQRVSLTSPAYRENSITARMSGLGVIAARQSPKHLLSIDFGSAPSHTCDLGPELPLILRW